MIFKNLTKKFYINFFFIFIIFLLDRISKLYTIYLSNKFNTSELYNSKFLNISLTWNEGIAFGLLSFNRNDLYNYVTLIILAVIFVVFVMMIKCNSFKRIFLLMIFAGAICNFYDRIFYKAVPDFIDFHVEEFHWFTFNVADIFISVGVICMILFELIYNKQSDNEKF